jgi:hypothetical protein
MTANLHDVGLPLGSRQSLGPGVAQDDLKHFFRRLPDMVGCKICSDWTAAYEEEVLNVSLVRS